MKKLLTALCFMLATTPLAFAQEKAKDADKTAPAAAEKSAKGDEGKAANGAPGKSKPKKNGKDTSDSGAKAPPAGGKPPRSRKTAT